MTLDDALVDVGIAFLQVEFSIKLLSYCEFDRIRPAEFDTHQVVLLEQENLAFPTGRFSTQEDIVRAAMVAVSLALAGSALTLDKAWDIAGIRPDPHSADGTVKLRTLVHMVRCAYAHGVADPKWEVRGDYRQGRCHVNRHLASLWAPTPEIMQRSSLAATVSSRRRGIGGVFGGRPDGVGR